MEAKLSRRSFLKLAGMVCATVLLPKLPEPEEESIIVDWRESHINYGESLSQEAIAYLNSLNCPIDFRLYYQGEYVGVDWSEYTDGTVVDNWEIGTFAPCEGSLSDIWKPS